MRTGGDGSAAKLRVAVLVAVGSLGGAVILGMLVFCCMRRHREAAAQREHDPISPQPVAVFPGRDTGLVRVISDRKASSASSTVATLPVVSARPSARSMGQFRASSRSLTQIVADAAASASYHLSRPLEMASSPSSFHNSMALQSISDDSSRDSGLSSPFRGTNQSNRSYDVRGGSGFSFQDDSDTSSSADRQSYSSYATDDRTTAMSLISVPSARIPPTLDLHRFSSTSSTASQADPNAASFIASDLTQPTTADGRHWYKTIESPTDEDRYTDLSVESERLSTDRESYEL